MAKVPKSTNHKKNQVNKGKQMKTKSTLKHNGIHKRTSELKSKVKRVSFGGTIKYPQSAGTSTNSKVSKASSNKSKSRNTSSKAKCDTTASGSTFIENSMWADSFLNSTNEYYNPSVKRYCRINTPVTNGRAEAQLLHTNLPPLNNNKLLQGAEITAAEQCEDYSDEAVEEAELTEDYGEINKDENDYDEEIAGQATPLLEESIEADDSANPGEKPFDIDITSDDEFKLYLHSNATVYTHGLLSIRLIYGCVEILGHIINAEEDKTFNIYSPAGGSLLYISNCTQIADVSTDKIGLENFDCLQAILLCKRLNTKLSQTLELLSPKYLFPSIQKNGTACTVRTASSLHRNHVPITVPPSWPVIGRTLTSNSRVFLAGDKGVGKSTLLRYLANGLLERHEAVLVVDLDPGQPEFTPSGCVSASVVRGPLLGPSYVHQCRPDICVYVSNINIKLNMDEYVHCCKYLLQLCSIYTNMPTLINYIGYTRGMGQELISLLISYAKPTDVVQINLPNGRYNFKRDLTVKNVKEDAAWIINAEKNDLNFNHVIIDSMKESSNPLQSFTPRELRNMAIIAYFSEMLKGDAVYFTDSEVPIYSAPLNKIKVLDSLGNSYPAVCNANLVALCSEVTFEHVKIFNCLGWGIVRGISIANNKIYLLTPVEPEILEKVTHLIVGSVHLPPAMYIGIGDNVTGPVPYIEDGQQSKLAKPPKRQHFSLRKANRDDR